MDHKVIWKLVASGAVIIFLLLAVASAMIQIKVQRIKDRADVFVQPKRVTTSQTPRSTMLPTTPSVSQPDTLQPGQSLPTETTTQSETGPQWLADILSQPRGTSRSSTRLRDLERGEEEPLPLYSREAPATAVPDYTEQETDRTVPQNSNTNAGQIARPPPTYHP